MPGRRAGTKPTPAASAIAAPRMNPRASAPSTRSGCFSFTQSASSRDRLLQRRGVGEQRRDVLEPDARRREVRDLADLRAEVDHVPGLSLGQFSQVAPEEQRRQLARELGELLQVVQPLRAALVAAGAQRRRDELLEQRRLAAGGGAEGAQVPRRRRRSARAARRSRRRRRRTRDSACRRRCPCADEQPEVLELLRELARDRRRARTARRGRPPPPRAPSAVGRRRLRSFCPGASSSSLITRSGRNSSRCSRRIVCSRSRSSSLKRR